MGEVHTRVLCSISGKAARDAFPVQAALWYRTVKLRFIAIAGHVNDLNVHRAHVLHVLVPAEQQGKQFL